LQAKQTDKQTEPQRDRNERKSELKETEISQREREKYFKERRTKIILIKIIPLNKICFCSKEGDKKIKKLQIFFVQFCI
jgi:hypothetical protein